MPRRQPPGVAERAHPGGSGGFDSISTVFDDCTPRGGDSHASRGVKKEIRSRLAAGDLAGGEDAGGGPAGEPSEAERVANAPVTAAPRGASDDGGSAERL